MLTGHDKRPVLFERALIHQLGDILSRHSVTTPVSFRHSVGSVFVQGKCVAAIVFRQIRPNVIGIQLLVFDNVVDVNFGLFNKYNRVSVTHDVAS